MKKLAQISAALGLGASSACMLAPQQQVQDPAKLDESPPPQECAVHFKGTIASIEGETAVLADPADPNNPIRVPTRYLGERDGSGVCLKAMAPPASHAPPSASGAHYAVGEPLGGSLHRCPRTECRALVEFCCEDDGTSTPIGLCGGFRACPVKE